MVQYKNARFGVAETERKAGKSRALWGSAVVECRAPYRNHSSTSSLICIFDMHQVVKKRKVLITLHRVGICTYETCTRIYVYALGLNPKVALKAFDCSVANDQSNA